MCIKNTEKSFIKLQKQRIKFFFFLVVSNLTYGKNISDNEHQLIFSIRYSNSWVWIVLFVFSIWSIFKNELFGIWYSLNFQKRIYLVFGPYSLFVATLFDVSEKHINQAQIEQLQQGLTNEIWVLKELTNVKMGML